MVFIEDSLIRVSIIRLWYGETGEGLLGEWLGLQSYEEKGVGVLLETGGIVSGTLEITDLGSGLNKEK